MILVAKLVCPRRPRILSTCRFQLFYELNGLSQARHGNYVRLLNLEHLVLTPTSPVAWSHIVTKALAFVQAIWFHREGAQPG